MQFVPPQIKMYELLIAFLSSTIYKKKVIQRKKILLYKTQNSVYDVTTPTRRRKQKERKFSDSRS